MTKLDVVLARRHGDDLPGKLRHHPFHPCHSLYLVVPDADSYGVVRYHCDACKLLGVGARYECGSGCDVDLHVDCALALYYRPERKIGGFTFVLLRKPPAPVDGTVCDACGEDARGFIYHCFDIGDDLHPGCAQRRKFELAGLSFKLSRKDPPPGRCVLCEKKIQCRPCHFRCSRRHGRDAWYYRCDIVYAGDYGGEQFSTMTLHVACARILASKGFADVPLDVACDRAVAYASGAIVTGGGGGVKKPFHVYRGEEIIPVSAPALRALLLQRKKKGAGGCRGGKLGRSLKVMGFIARVVIGIIVGDPTAMIAAVAGVLFSGN